MFTSPSPPQLKPHGDVIRKTELFLSLVFLFLFFPAPPCCAHSSLMKLWEFRGKRGARAQSTMGRANFGSSEKRAGMSVRMCARGVMALCMLILRSAVIPSWLKLQKWKLWSWSCSLISYLTPNHFPPLPLPLCMLDVCLAKKHRGLSNFRGLNKPMTQYCLCACCLGNPDSQKERQRGDMMSGRRDLIGQHICVKQYRNFLYRTSLFSAWGGDRRHVHVSLPWAKSLSVFVDGRRLGWGGVTLTMKMSSNQA